MNTLSRLRSAFNEIIEFLENLIREVPIKKLNQRGSSLVIIAPEYYWEEPSTDQRSVQMHIKRKYDSLSELLRLLFARAPEDVLRKLEEADKSIRMWLELDSNWLLTPDRDKNEELLKSDAKSLHAMLDILDASPEKGTILVPDTNSLLVTPDPIDYRELITDNKFTFVLLPTVLGELDELKVLHRNPDVRDKAKKAIKRIKGWRKQGSLREGVTVDKTILLKAFHSEPDMDCTLSWLDKDVSDDRIIASVLEIQAEYPCARIILVTGDINLQNKADAALIEVTGFE